MVEKSLTFSLSFFWLKKQKIQWGFANSFMIGQAWEIEMI
jgi:hypothetical protein